MYVWSPNLVSLWFLYGFPQDYKNLTWQFKRSSNLFLQLRVPIELLKLQPAMKTALPSRPFRPYAGFQGLGVGGAAALLPLEHAFSPKITLWVTLSSAQECNGTYPCLGL